MPLAQRFGGRPRRPAEERVEAGVRHLEARAVAEVVQVEPERAVGLQVDQVVENRLCKNRLAVGGQAHDLVFARVDAKPRVVRERRIEQAQRMGEMEFANHLQAPPAPHGRGGGRPFAHAVHGQHRGLVEGGRVEGAGGVRQMMLGEEQLPAPVHVRVHGLQLSSQQVLLEQLFLDPDRHCSPERTEAPGRKGDRRLHQSLELEEGLVVEDDPVDVAGPQARAAQAPRRGAGRVAGVVLLAREALFLGRRNDPPVLHESRGAVVVERGNA